MLKRIRADRRRRIAVGYPGDVVQVDNVDADYVTLHLICARGNCDATLLNCVTRYCYSAKSYEMQEGETAEAAILPRDTHARVLVRDGVVVVVALRGEEA